MLTSANPSQTRATEHIADESLISSFFRGSLFSTEPVTKSRTGTVAMGTRSANSRKRRAIMRGTAVRGLTKASIPPSSAKTVEK